MTAKPLLSLEDYLSFTLPPNGIGNFFIYRKAPNSDKPQQEVRKTHADVAERIRHWAAKRFDVWVGTGAFSARRKSDNCVGKQTLYADIDCGPNKHYKTRKELLAAIEKAITEDGLPKPTIIMSSGTGVHLYWCLEEHCDADVWLSLSFRLRALFEQIELHADMGITVDVARILRPPETHNFKDASRVRPVQSIAYDLSCVYSPEWLYMQLPPLEMHEIGRQASALSAAAKATPAQISSSTVSMDDLISGKDLSPYERLNDSEKLAIVQKMLDHVSSPRFYDDYTMWMKIGTAVKDASSYSSDANADDDFFDLWDTWSRQGQNYGGTRAKWSQFKDFHSISMGTLVYHAQQQGFVFSNAAHNVNYPPGYIATNWGTLREAREGEDSNAIVFEAHFVGGDVTFSSGDEGKGLIYRADVVHPKTGLRTKFETNTKNMNSGTPFQNDLAAAGIHCHHEKQKNEALTFVKTFMDDLIAARGSVNETVTRFGWVNQNSRWGFCAGEKTFWEDGSSSPANVREVGFRDIYCTKGSAQVWKSTVQAMLDQGRPEVSLGIAVALAAPLVHFTGVSGVVISLVSSNSGTGKSATLKGSQSFWGEPKTGINALDDTTNAVTRRLEVLQHLPAYWDELRMREQVRDFIRIMFQLSQGKGKSRMSSAAVLQNVGQWETMIAVAGNEPLVPIINANVGNTNAGALRLIELDMPPVPDTPAANKLKGSLIELEHNYGHAALEYGEKLAQNREAVKQLVMKVQESLRQRVNAKTEERFWLGALSAITAGAALATRWGILRFDLQALNDYVLKLYMSMRAKLTDIDGCASPIDYVNKFTHALMPQGLVTDHINLSPTGQPKLLTIESPQMLSSLRFPVAYQHAVNDKLLAINFEAFRAWLDQYGVSSSTVRKELERLGATIHTRVTLGSGCGLANKVRSTVLILDLTNPMLTDVI